MGPVRAAWGRGKVAWGGVGLSRVEYHGTDAEASLTSGRRPSGVGGYYLGTWSLIAYTLIEPLKEAFKEPLYKGTRSG